MKRVLKKMLAYVLLAAVVLSLMPAANVKADGASTLAPAEDGNWYYYTDGAVNYDYTGLVSNEAGWWLVMDGRIAFDYTGLWCDPVYGWWLIGSGAVLFDYTGLWNDPNYGWWLINGGSVAFDYTGLWNDPNCGWWLIGNGAILFDYTGLWNDPNYGWWLIDGGTVAFNYTGLWNDPNCGWWLIGNGAIVFDYTGLWNDPNYGWWLIRGGTVAFDTTGLWNDPNCGWWLVGGGAVVFDYNGLWSDPNYGWWLVRGGTVAFDYNGLWDDPNCGWWFVNGGAIDFNYTGIADNGSGKWYVVNGTIAFDYSGTVNVGGTTYTVLNGQVTNSDGSSGTSSGTYQIMTGNLQPGTICMIRSAVNPEYALTAVESATAENGYNLIMSKLTGDESQKFMVLEDGPGYCFLSMKYYDENGVNPDGKWLINAFHGGWDSSMPGGADNVQITSNRVGGSMTWILEETSPGAYNVRVNRDDFALYLNVADGVYEGANVQAGNSSLPLSVNFVYPYMQSLPDGTYNIVLSADQGMAFTMADSSVKDFATLTVSPRTAGSEQLFNITCVDPEAGLYTIRNVNSQRYLHNQGSNAIGDGISQVTYSDQRDLRWYIQQRADGSYSIINANNNQVLTADASGVVQGVGNDSASQKFIMTPASVGAKSLEAGVYNMGGQNYRLSHVGNGVYNIYNLSRGYAAASGDSITYQPADDSNASKWIISRSGGGYMIQSVSSGKYFTADGSLSPAGQVLSLANVTNAVTNYAARYDLSALNTLSNSAYNDRQVVKRMNMLGLNRDDLMDPISAAASVENTINSELSGLPTSVIQFNGSTVSELNRFMKQNMGNIIQLTQDIRVQPDATYNDVGQIRIPSNVILDGNGHKLIAATDKLPNVGIVFFYNDDNDGYKQKTSSNCGVINLTSDIPYEHNTLSVVGADKIWVEGNNFTNAGLNAILINDEAEGRPRDITSVGIIKGNILGSTGSDTLGVYGNNDKLLICNNTVYGSGEYGIIVSCLRTETPIRVDQETDGPHDIIVRDNEVYGTTKCAMYYLGAYRVYVTGNTLHDSQLEGVCFDSGCIGCYFANNTVFNTSKDGGLPGVSIDNGIYNIIDNNNVYDNGSAGIKIVRAGYGNVIVNNTCRDNNKKVFDIKGNIGIGIEVNPIDPVKEPGYDLILDTTGSDANVVYNNTVSGSHHEGIAISKDAENGRNINNVVKYNEVSSTSGYATVDYSSWNNDMKNNIVP